MNHQVRGVPATDVVRALGPLVRTRAFVAPPCREWTAVYDETCDEQDEVEVRRLAQVLSQQFATAVFAFLIHHSDVFVYVLFDRGTLVDEYCTEPEQRGARPRESAARFRGRPEALQPYCRTATALATIAAVLHGPSTAAFAEDRLFRLAELLDLDRQRVQAGFRDVVEARQEGLAPYRRYRLVASIRPKAEQARLKRFFASIEQGDLATVRQLLAEGVSPNEMGLHRVSPLWLAARVPQSEIARVLLEAGADPLTKDPSLGTALIPAAGNGLVDLMRVLIAAGVDVHAVNSYGHNAAGAAALAGQIPALELALAAGVTPNGADEHGRSSLMQAAFWGHTEVARRLLAAGADVHARDQRGAGALMHAAIAGRAEIVRMLLARGADPQAVDADGRTPRVAAEQVLANAARGSWGAKALADLHGVREVLTILP